MIRPIKWEGCCARCWRWWLSSDPILLRMGTQAGMKSRTGQGVGFAALDDATRPKPFDAARREAAGLGVRVPSPAPSALIKGRIVDELSVQRTSSLVFDAQADEPNDEAKQ